MTSMDINHPSYDDTGSDDVALYRKGTTTVSVEIM